MVPSIFSSTTEWQQCFLDCTSHSTHPLSWPRQRPFNMDSKQIGESADRKATIETVEDPSKFTFRVSHVAGKDRAAELLGNTAERIIVSEADNKRILRRIDFTLLPIMLGVYFLQQLDKSTLSYASVFGLITVRFGCIEIYPIFEILIFAC